MVKQFSTTRTIAAPVERVWSILTDAAAYPSWNPTVVSLTGDLRLGGRIALVSTLDPKRTFKLKVSEMSAPSRMVWSSGMPFGLFRGTRTFLLGDRGGSTEFSMTEVFSGPMAGLITKAIPDMTESFDQFAAALATAAA